MRWTGHRHAVYVPRTRLPASLWPGAYFAFVSINQEHSRLIVIRGRKCRVACHLRRNPPATANVPNTAAIADKLAPKFARNACLQRVPGVLAHPLRTNLYGR